MTLTTEGGLVYVCFDAVVFSALKSSPVIRVVAAANLFQLGSVAGLPGGIVGADLSCQSGESTLKYFAGVDTHGSVDGILDVRVAADRCSIVDGNCTEDSVLIGNPDRGVVGRAG